MDEKEKAPRIDYDNLMKTTLTQFFTDALELLLPKLRAALDMDAKPEFLNTEFPKVTFDAKGGAKRADVLASIRLTGGDQKVALIIGPRPKGEPKFYFFESEFGVVVIYKYVTVDVMEMPDELLLDGDNRMGLVLYAMKKARQSGSDEGMKFRYLREVSSLWAERKWSPEDKLTVLAAVEYLIGLKDEDYAKQYVEHMASLMESMDRGESEMYESVFQRVYTAEGMAQGMAQGIAQGMAQGIAQGRVEGSAEGYAKGRTEVARNMLRKGFSVDSVVECTTLPREEVESLANL